MWATGIRPFRYKTPELRYSLRRTQIIRVGLDARLEIAVLGGSANVQGVAVAENQTSHSGAVAQGVNPDSWENWKQDRD